MPKIRVLVKGHLRNGTGKADRIAQAETVCNVICITLQIGLGREILRPCPFLLQGFVKTIRVFDAFDVNARARVAIPVPRAAHAIARL